MNNKMSGFVKVKNVRFSQVKVFVCGKYVYCSSMFFMYIELGEIYYT